MSIENVQQELNEFLDKADVDIVKIKSEDIFKAAETIFDSEEGQRMLSLAIDVFNKALEAHIKERGEITLNDKVNIIAQVLVVLEMQKHITVNSKENAREE